MCGFDEGYEDYPLLYFPIPKTDYLATTVCVKSCPTGPGPVECHPTSVPGYDTVGECENNDDELAQSIEMGLTPAGKFFVYASIPCTFYCFNL